MQLKDHLLTGRLYYAVHDPELARGRDRARAILRKFNSTSGV